MREGRLSTTQRHVPPYYRTATYRQMIELPSHLRQGPMPYRGFIGEVDPVGCGFRHQMYPMRLSRLRARRREAEGSGMPRTGWAEFMALASPEDDGSGSSPYVPDKNGVRASMPSCCVADAVLKAAGLNGMRRDGSTLMSRVRGHLAPPVGWGKGGTASLGARRTFAQGFLNAWQGRVQRRFIKLIGQLVIPGDAHQ